MSGRILTDMRFLVGRKVQVGDHTLYMLRDDHGRDLLAIDAPVEDLVKVTGPATTSAIRNTQRSQAAGPGGGGGSLRRNGTIGTDAPAAPGAGVSTVLPPGTLIDLRA